MTTFFFIFTKISKFFSIVFLCIILLYCTNTHKPVPPIEDEVAEINYAYGIAIDTFDIVEGTVHKGETLGGILSSLGANQQTLKELTLLPKDSFDVRQIRAGKEYLAFYDSDSVLTYFVYKQSDIHSVVFHLIDSLHVEHQLKDIDLERKEASAVIESSLWNAFVDADIPVELALELSEIYAWTIDFFALQRGDSVSVVYDEKSVEGKFIGIGNIYAAHFFHGGKLQNAYFYEYDDITGYYDETGKNLRKAFLKAPLNYKRISSTFTYARKHPIYKTVRPHTGVDYAAPAGTPVVALGDGVVIEKGFKGGGGNTVKIRHNSTYTTAYLHLSKYGSGIEVGKYVNQGQVIGYVGSTGASTGPHLDFRVWKNGQPTNPLTLESPSADPVPEEYKAHFDSIVSSYNY